MPKRSAEKKLHRYEKKIKKLKEKEEQRRRIRQVLDSSDDENHEGTFLSLRNRGSSIIKY